MIFKVLASTTKFLFTTLAVVISATSFTYAAEGTSRQALSTSILRVCADPSNLPYSNDKLEGFENKIIDLLAKELDLPVRYTWYPQSIGFVRRTLRIRECDLISGITTTSQLVQNTNPYYRSAYTMVYRTDSGITATSVADEQLKDKTIGVVAGTPPATLLTRYGLLGQARPYQRTVDTRYFSSVEQAIKDVVDGVTDFALLWGPIAGYHVSKSETPLTLVPLLNEPKDIRLDFRVSMAVRYNETDWKRLINRKLKKIRPEINKLLSEYGVPLLDDNGVLISK